MCGVQSSEEERKVCKDLEAFSAKSPAGKRVETRNGFAMLTKGGSKVLPEMNRFYWLNFSNQ